MRPHRAAAAKSRGAELSFVGFGVLGLAVLCTVVTAGGCCPDSLDGSGGFALRQSDLYSQLGGGRSDRVDPQDPCLNTATADVFGFLNNNPSVVSVDGTAVRVAGDGALAQTDGPFQIVNGQFRRGGQSGNLARATGN